METSAIGWPPWLITFWYIYWPLNNGTCSYMYLVLTGILRILGYQNVNQSKWPSNCTGFHGHHVRWNSSMFTGQSPRAYLKKCQRRCTLDCHLGHWDGDELSLFGHAWRNACFLHGWLRGAALVQNSVLAASRRRDMEHLKRLMIGQVEVLSHGDCRLVRKAVLSWYVTASDVQAWARWRCLCLAGRV